MAPFDGSATGNNASVGQNEETSSERKPGSPWIRYRTHYRHTNTNELIKQKDDPPPQSQDEKTDYAYDAKDPVFEKVTTLKIGTSGNVDSAKLASSISSLTSATARRTHHIEIFSPAIINAIRSIVKYYPQQDLMGTSVIVHWPYPILVHYYDELTEWKDKSRSASEQGTCARNFNAYEHLTLLLDFLDEEVMAEVNEEKARFARGFSTWEWEWVVLRPGTTLTTRFSNSKEDYTPVVIHSVKGGIFEDPPVSWDTSYWNMAYDGAYLGRRLSKMSMKKYDGEAPWKDLKVVDMEKDADDPVVQDLIEMGKSYWQLLHKTCRQHKGPSKQFPYNEVDGLVMVDIKSYYNDSDNRLKRPTLLSLADCRTWVTDCTCAHCRQSRGDSTKNVKPMFGNYNGITTESWDDLTPHQYFLCEKRVPAFAFKTREWVTLSVSQLSEPKFEESMIDNLVMERSRLDMIKALSKSFRGKDRRNAKGAKIDRSPWSADFVSGKGSGLILLLHGKPGVGKTCTAECVAEFTQAPLMVLTCSDIGTDPVTVELNLRKNFKRAQSWGAVLLIDEADIFMERRTTEDLVRNSLVAGFLRALEFYDGILFLTTNRVGTFDEAFVSRIHIQLFYPDFTDNERQRIWKTFIDKLERERGDFVRLSLKAEEYLQGDQVKAVRWNGREIRNAFQTAVALAEYESQVDKEGVVLLTDKHLRAVIELSKDFKTYLQELHRGDESKRAARRYERHDDFAASK